MYRYPSRARSGPHSIHDARQYAWSLLVFGPGAPAPRQRVHPGMLPDVYVAASARRRSLISRVIAFFRREAREGAPDQEGGHGRQGSSDTGTGLRPGKENTRNPDRLAA